MKRRHFMLLPGAALLWARRTPGSQLVKQAQAPGGADLDKLLPDQVLLKDYRPRSVYKIPVTHVTRARFPVIDMHYHARVKTPEDVDSEVRIMDSVNVERTIVFAGTGSRFDEFLRLYGRHPQRFDVWCGLDMTGSGEAGFGDGTIKELERCHRLGAKGVGELIDKGTGIGGRVATGPGQRSAAVAGAQPAGMGPHADDPRMDAIWERAADLGMPINLHVSDPYWSYLPQDRYNDGLMNGFRWRLDDKPGLMGHDDLVASMDRVCASHPRCVFIAAHLVNLDYDLARLGQLFERHPNLYADMSARFCETSPVPRAASAFLTTYGHRVVYGTDIPYITQGMFELTFRILETLDEHFYARDVYFNFDYHWPMHGFGLPDQVLKKVYRDTALNAIARAQRSAKA